MEELIAAAVGFLAGGGVLYGALHFFGRAQPVATDQSGRKWPAYDKEIDKVSTSGLDRWNEYRRRQGLKK